jgi:hypothetical protein
MCALGDSAGSAAIAYSLAYYNAGSFLDAVELVSGPVFSDIKEGCGVGNGLGKQDPVTVCSSTSPNGGWGCQLGGGGTWALTPNFVQGTPAKVQSYTNEPDQCAGTVNTTDPSNTDWLRESIVDQSSTTGGPTPVFAYPQTSMSAWLCRTVANSNNYPCAANANNNANSCANNSSPQGQLFYQNIVSGTLNFNVYAVDGCQGAEGATGGTVPGFYPLDFGGTSSGGGTVTGYNAMIYDVVGYNSGTVVIPPSCVRRH